MILRTAAEMAAVLPTPGALFGLDLGTKTIGLATSDPGRCLASPVETLRRAKFSQDAAQVMARMDERQIQGLVLGWPLEMDGNEGKRCQSTMSFARNFLEMRAVPILLWDERLSTSAVERMMVREFDMTRDRRAAKVDAAAAAYILQGALDALGRCPRPDV
ncbi:Holliday junction resolvase RuvX [Roseospira marina]|uniref:Putative pre-16S rRNA nuclease n=1 Tax=Roseospira marina TaxID=140057 RepID=A0A5M6IFG5_9PROT|nr:Holliday junction resolvase RuvX [Roseospira marina]KAA5606872.1 Holliday junction resolvase RuvX [Roseospira marina]MBB4312960.1 putative Holliday junction resolvase [Roseospira marina]MBB5086267.1 putative Holliday junction resolvase [Roseospira marina]